MNTSPSSILDAPPQSRYLFVASTGGHLSQLTRIAKTLDASSQSIWVTFDTPQSRSLLEGQRVEFVPYVRPRDWLGALRAAARIRRLLKRHDFDIAISTGAALALSALPYARYARRIRSIYIESVSRIDGPSLSGRMLARVPGISTYTQHSGWASDRWKVFPSVLATFKRAPANSRNTKDLRILVSLGTIEGYRFDALVDGVLATGLAGDSTVWQLGVTSRQDVPGRSGRVMSAAAFTAAAAEADIVITHAGVGTVMQLLEMGIYPIVVPRSSDAGEHVDNHQHQIARLVTQTKTGLCVMPHELTPAILMEAMQWRVVDGDEEGGISEDSC